MSVFGQGASRICAVVAARSARECRRLVRTALRDAPTIELRLDWLASDRERLSLLVWLKRYAPKKAVFIATCRRLVGGGKFAGSAAKELFWLRKAKEAGCLWCDLEVETLRELPGKNARGLALPKVLLSIHDFKRTPAFACAPSATKAGVDAVKIAALSRTLSDSTRLVQLAHGQKNVVAVPMGEIGLPARILGLQQSSALLYAPVDAPTAPGQVGLREIMDLYRAHELTERTRVYGVIGNPIRHSLSPLLHNTGHVAVREDAVFLPFLVENLRDFLKFVRDFGVVGFSVTIPHKQEIFNYLDECEPLAREIGAVNTVTVGPGGKLAGSNTDYLGVLEALKGKLRLKNSRVLILGAGGAARAAVFALAKAEAEVLVCARREGAAKRLAQTVNGDIVRRSALRREKFDSIINATPIGMYPHHGRSPLDPAELNCELVMDLIYRPLKTKLLRMAEARRIRTVSGVEMFLAQGIAQWELWMGRPAPRAAMRRSILEKLRSEEKDR